MSERGDVVFLFDCDNTLLDNDAVLDDLRAYMERECGPSRSARYWEIFETLRAELGYADYLGALQRCRLENQSDMHLLSMSAFLLDYPFASRLYPGALDAVRRLRTMGQTVILSDGDVVFQPRKIRCSGLWDEVEGRVLIYIHKEAMLDEVARLYPAQRYVMIDDKLRILAAMKAQWGSRLTTVFPRQGHYAHDPAQVAAYPPADMTIEHIGVLGQADFVLPLNHGANAGTAAGS